MRFDRFKAKYQPHQATKLEEFIDLDDKIKFNTDEYSLYNTVSD